MASGMGRREIPGRYDVVVHEEHHGMPRFAQADVHGARDRGRREMQPADAAGGFQFPELRRHVRRMLFGLVHHKDLPRGRVQGQQVAQRVQQSGPAAVGRHRHAEVRRRPAGRVRLTAIVHGALPFARSRRSFSACRRAANSTNARAWFVQVNCAAVRRACAPSRIACSGSASKRATCR